MSQIDMAIQCQQIKLLDHLKDQKSVSNASLQQNQDNKQQYSNNVQNHQQNNYNNQIMLNRSKQNIKNIKQHNQQKYKLAMMIIINKSYKNQIRSIFKQIKCWNLFFKKQIEDNLEINQQIKKMKYSNEKEINQCQFKLVRQMIENTLLIGKNNLGTQIHKNVERSLLKENFDLKMQNQSQKIIINQLRKSLQQRYRRQIKENEKKRQSVEMLAQQITEKNQIIDELKLMLKMNNTKISNLILEENPQFIKNNMVRLEGVNEQLNENIRIIDQAKKQMAEQVEKLSLKIVELKDEIHVLKEDKFDWEMQRLKMCEVKDKMNGLLKRYQKKLTYAKEIEKKYNEIYRQHQKDMVVCTASTEQTSQDHKQDKKSTQNTQNILINSNRNVSAQVKLEQVLNYLVNIEDDEYQLKFGEFFEEDQFKLLYDHRKFIHENMKRTKSSPIDKKIIQQNRFQDSIVYFQGQFQNATILDVLEQKTNRIIPANIQLIEAEIRKNQQINKISELKNKILHVRNIIFNLLKAIDVHNFKGQSQGILEIILDVFQYSEDEKKLIFQEKRKKIFGII